MEVLDLANREDRVLVTFDKDFSELVVREKARLSPETLHAGNAGRRKSVFGTLCKSVFTPFHAEPHVSRGELVYM